MISSLIEKPCPFYRNGVVVESMESGFGFVFNFIKVLK